MNSWVSHHWFVFLVWPSRLPEFHCRVSYFLRLLFYLNPGFLKAARGFKYPPLIGVQWAVDTIGTGFHRKSQTPIFSSAPRHISMPVLALTERSGIWSSWKKIQQKRIEKKEKTQGFSFRSLIWRAVWLHECFVAQRLGQERSAVEGRTSPQQQALASVQTKCEMQCSYLRLFWES